MILISVLYQNASTSRIVGPISIVINLPKSSLNTPLTTKGPNILSIFIPKIRQFQELPFILIQTILTVLLPPRLTAAAAVLVLAEKPLLCYILLLDHRFIPPGP